MCERIDYHQLINNNHNWAAEKLASQPDFFKNLSSEHKPRFLFIGCSDSRVSLNTLTGAELGELFIHRNIANQVSLTDMNLLAVLEYAIDSLEVEHVIVCGHYACGGVTAAYHECASGVVDNWVDSIKDLAQKYSDELEKFNTDQEKIDRLAELNTIHQVRRLLKTSVLRRAVKENRAPQLHGWVIDIYHGKIKELELPLDEWKEAGRLPADYQTVSFMP